MLIPQKKDKSLGSHSKYQRLQKWLGAAARRGRTPEGFTLVVTLVILAAVTILVVGLFGIVSRERQTSATYDAVDQADLAVQAGLDRVGLMLKGALADELGVMFSVPLTPALDDKQRPREMLMAANFDATAGVWKYQPLASGVARPADGDTLKMPISGFESTPATDKVVGPAVDANAIEARRLPTPSPWAARVPRYWMQMRLPGKAAGGQTEEGQAEEAPPAEDKLVARYSFYVEDLQGKLNLANAGVHDSDKNLPHYETDMTQTVVPAPIPYIPGLKIDQAARWRRSPVSVWTLLRPDLEPLSVSSIPADLNAMHRRLTAINTKRLAFTPEMWREQLLVSDPLTNWPGLELVRLNGPAARLPNGSLADAQLRTLEENTTGYLAPYDELALVPHGPGFAFGGERKLNLNKFLVDTGGSTGPVNHQKMVDSVNEMATHINRHLPNFKSRAGGYPRPRNAGNREINQMAYLKNLAAGMLDYADMDGLPSINVPSGGAASPVDETAIEYRGADSYPVVNEYWQRYRFDEFLGRHVKVSITDYVELYNPTNHIVTGDVTCCFEAKGRFSLGSRSYQVMNSLHMVDEEDPDGKKPQPIDGLQGYWFQPQSITLQPNEIKVLAFSPVIFKLDGGELGNVTGVAYYGTAVNNNYQDDRDSRYRLAFRPIDGSGNAVVPNYTVVDLPFTPLERYEKKVNSSSPKQLFNVNEPGLAYRLRQRGFAWNVGDSRAAYYIDYHQEEISYTAGSSPGGRNLRSNMGSYLPGESRTFLWPDGGHDTIPCTDHINNRNLDPDSRDLAPTVNPLNSLAERQKFVQRISNAGRFYSMTELGHIFDPIMWNPNGATWFDQQATYAQHADLDASALKLNPSQEELDAHKLFCGGNTLRIGRVEHSLFRPDYRAQPGAGRPRNRGVAASSLLDMFHCGDANSMEAARITGPFTRIDGHVNINTASRETLRALIAGRLSTDPRLKRQSTDPEPDTSAPVLMLPATKSRADAQADVMATAIIQNRPYVTPAEVAEKAVLSPADAATMDKEASLLPLAANTPVFGYTKRDPSDDRKVVPEWNDAAAEELFARLWNNSSVRSRHFQVVVCGQAIKTDRDGTTHVTATRSRLFHVFVRPVRRADGTIERQDVEITYSRAL
ncbi:MAG: pilus assembly PilX N-terminal domain-containing protein [Verrucomicrobiota bacterium]